MGGLQLTVLANHAADPRAIVIHAVHAAIDLAAVVNAVCLPIAALGAPLGATIVLADEDIFGVEQL